MTTETLRAYDGIHEQRASESLTVGTEEALSEMLKDLAARRAAVTIRGSGYSLDRQSLTDRVLLRLDACGFHNVGVDVAARTVTVGARATWRQVLRATLAHGLVPPSMPTGPDITVAGSFSSGCISRFSHAWGSEIDHVLEIRVALASGEIRTLTPRDPLFAGFAGGHGWLGVVLAVKLRLRRITAANAAACVQTKVWTFEVPHDDQADANWNRFLEEVRSQGEQARAGRTAAGEHGFAAPVPGLFDAISTAGWFVGAKAEIQFFSSRYEARARRGHNGLAIYAGPTSMRYIGEYMLSVPEASEWVQALYYATENDAPLVHRPNRPRPDVIHENDVDPFVFFMEANTVLRRKQNGPHARGDSPCDHAPRPPQPSDAELDRASQQIVDVNARRLRGAKLQMSQQTVVVDLPTAKAILIYLQRTVAVAGGVRPTVFDVLYLPKDENPALLSPTRNDGGFAVTVAFQELSPREDGLPNAQAMLRVVARMAVEGGGHVSLVKSVAATRQDVHDSYGAARHAFLALKAEYDPTNLFRGTFFDDYMA